jgi:hypothetical protein
VCEYAGQSYSVGASICECPGVKGENVDWQGDHSRITSRRLTCNTEQVWEDTKTFCIDVSTSATSRLYDKYREHFCPRIPVNFAEITKAVNEEIAKVIDKAPRGTLVSMIEGICRRIRLDAQCKALLDAMSASP